MVPLGAPVDPELLREQLTDATRVATFHDLEVHMFFGNSAADVLQEIGRIREVEYRTVGAGRNVARDLDAHDTESPAYLQIVSFDREEGELVAMYRAIHCGWALGLNSRHRGSESDIDLSAVRTSSLFEFSDSFVNNDLPRCVELGRSVVNRNARRAVQGLFSVWSGLGAIVREWPDMLGFFGNVSVYSDVDDAALATLLAYLYTHHGDPQRRVTARPHCRVTVDPSRVEAPKTLSDLTETASKGGWMVPPILLSYLKASPDMLAFDTAQDADFGGAREIAILVPISGITAKMRRRFIDPYESVNPGLFRLPALR